MAFGQNIYQKWFEVTTFGGLLFSGGGGGGGCYFQDLLLTPVIFYCNMYIWRFATFEGSLLSELRNEDWDL